jgi:hypothetical protein
MAREKPNAWECEHPLPIEVVPFGEGRRARCLVCGLCGPERPDTEEALWALRGRRAAGRGSAPEGSQPPNFSLRGLSELRSEEYSEGVPKVRKALTRPSRLLL